MAELNLADEPLELLRAELVQGGDSIRKALDMIDDLLEPPVEEPPVVEPPKEEPPTAYRAVPPELPRELIDTWLPKPTGRVISLRSGDDFQTALMGLQDGDVVELEAGATWAGRFVLQPRETRGGVVIIRSSRWTELPEGKRVGPEDAPKLARIIGGSANRRTIETRPGADGYRFIGVEVGLEDSVPAVVNTLIELELGSERVIFDRCYIHGNPSQHLTRGVILNNARSAVIHSTIAECHGKGVDSQAILGYRGPGPFLIENNRLEGSGENIMFGGAGVGPDGLPPSDIVIRNNHIIKPLSWKGIWTVKNLLELKIAERVLIQDNIFENSWPGGQTGFCFNIKSENRNITTFPNLATRDVLICNNRILNSRFGASIIGGASTKEKTGEGRTSRVRLEENEFVFSEDEQYPRAFQLAFGVIDLAIVNNEALRGRVMQGPSVVWDHANLQDVEFWGNQF